MIKFKTIIDNSTVNHIITVLEEKIMLQKAIIKSQLLKNQMIDRLSNQQGEPDGGGLSWLAKLGIGFSILALIAATLNALFPGILQAIFTKIQSFFA